MIRLLCVCREPMGAPDRSGERQPTLACRLTDPATLWQSLTVCWYGKQQRLIEIATGTAVWFHNGLPPVAIRWVLLRDPEDRFDPQARLCTDQQAEAKQIVEWFVLRWQMEVTFHEVRAHLGVETQRQWSDLAILRTPLPCSRFFLWSPSLLISCSRVSRCLSVRRLGIGKRFPPFPIRWLWFVSISGR